MRRVHRRVGLSANDSSGRLGRPDVDLCRAIAITLFGDASKAKILSISALQRFTAPAVRRSGCADPQHHAPPDARDTTLGLIGVGVNYYDSQGIMVNKSLNVKAPRSWTAPRFACSPAPPPS